VLSFSFSLLAVFAPHGQCYLWSGPLITTHVLADAGIALAYFSIPFSLALIWKRLGDPPYHWLFVFFGAFIFACGSTHALEIWNIWHSDYWLAAAVKAFTAVASLTTAVLLASHLPKLLSAPTAKQLARSQDELERRVVERTSALEATMAELRKEEENHRFLAETMPQIMWTAKPDGVLDYYNQKWFEYSGFSSIHPDDWTTAVYPDDLAQCLETWSRALQNGTTYQFEFRLRRAADGEFRWHLVRALPQRDAGGAVVRWVGTCTDIHDQKLAEQRLEQGVKERTAALAASEERFRLAFEVAGIGMAIVGLKGGFVQVNRALCEIVGYKEDELRTKTFQEITHPDDLDTDLANLKDLLAGLTTSYQMEKRYIHRCGYTVWVRLTVALVRDLQNRPVHFISQIEDITERKRLETNLADARDQALEASRMKSEFLATMSHEIRTPMNGIIGMSGLIMETSLTPEQQEMGSIIRRSGESLLTIINDILDFSKIEAGKLRLEPAPFVLRDLLEENASLLAPQAREKNLEVICEVDPQLAVKLSGDAGRIQQVVTNLLGNAIKFTPRGEVILKATAKEVGELELSVRIEVQDSGIGISEQVKQSLFQPFMQGDGSVTRRFGGTGLGLAISRQLIGLMGGEIGVESQEGRGSTFWFEVTLPRAESAWTNTADIPPAGFRALVVDDNETNRRIFVAQLDAIGVKVQAAASADEALIALSEALACGRPFHLALLDARMPGMDGLALAAKIRATPELSSLILVMMSSAPPEAFEENLAALKFSAMLTKPVRQAQLNRTLCRLLGRKEAESAPPGTNPPLPLERPRSLNLLLAEDDVANQLVGRLMLEQMGHRVDVVADGIQALQRLAVGSFDAVLLDCQMPGLDGFEVARRIRRGEAGAIDREIPIIALTAHALREDRERCLAAGMNEYASKPFSRREILNCFERCGLLGPASA
jgi:two-component system, sensor histidine kinase and response regulator